MQVSKVIYNKVIEVIEQEIKLADYNLQQNKRQIKKLAEEQRHLKNKKKEAYDMIFLVKNKKVKV